MRFLDRIRTAVFWTGTDRELSDAIDKVEKDVFRDMPWALTLPEHHQNDLIEFIMKRDI